VASAQYNADLRIHPSEDRDHCYQVELNYTGEKPSKLASQNYRIFYDASLSKFDEKESQILLPESDYLFSVVQTNHDIDASGIGPLEFESNLGFINATVLLNDTRLDGLSLNEEKGWTPMVELCFDMMKDQEEARIILARQDLTKSYGRAFVELSVVDQFDAVQYLTIDHYVDID